MSAKLDFRALSITLFIAGLVSYILCIVGDVWLDWTMYQVWMPLMPGFTWPLTPSGFTIGLLWLIAYSFFGTALIVLPYNLFVRNESIFK
jgi:hypothetical protein